MLKNIFLIFSIEFLKFLICFLFQSFISCPFGIQNVGYVIATYGASTVVSNIVIAQIAGFTGRHFLYALAFTLNMTIFVTLYLWTPDQEYYLFIIAAVWGIPEGVWQAQTNGILCFAIFFP